MTLVVIIPAYNESKVIAEVVHSVPRKLPGIDKIIRVVVDDNSRDDTKAVAEAAGALCIRHAMNLGAGGATITGFAVAKRLGADIVVTLDGDGQHEGTDMPNLVAPIVEGQVDVVLGSRLKGGNEQMPFYKVFGNNLLNIVTFLFFGLWVSDSQSGYKAFSKKALDQIELSTSGYEFCSEIIGEIKRKKLRYVEVPISTIYTDYSKAKGQLALNAVNIVLGLLLKKIR